MISIGNYYDADALKIKADEMEKVEMSRAAIESEIDMDKERSKLSSNHDKTLHALLRRVERDRREQLKHRQFDTQRLVQRNKNLIKDIFNRQAQEKRKTKKFLQWALSDINWLEDLNTNKKQNQSVDVGTGRKIKHIIKDNLGDIKKIASILPPHTQNYKKTSGKYKILLK